jgi:hypothetical protein
MRLSARFYHRLISKERRVTAVIPVAENKKEFLFEPVSLVSERLRNDLVSKLFALITL